MADGLSATIDALAFARLLVSGNLDNPLPVFDVRRPFVYPDTGSASQYSFGPFPSTPRDNIVRLTMRPDDPGDNWFELLHILPRFLFFGNVLSTVTANLEINNASRIGSRTIQSFTNNAGEGTEIINLPSFPFVLPPQSSLLMTLQLEAQGAPAVDATLVFANDLSYDLIIPITATRLVAFPFEPDIPLKEQLKFLTDVFVHKNGTEQRIALRESPRQEFSMPFFLEEGDELSTFDQLVFDWQSRVFGVPVWTEPTRLTAAAASSGVTINVESTALASYRVGGLVIVWGERKAFDILEIESFTATTITLKSPLNGSYAQGTLVMPARTAVLEQQIQGSRHTIGLGRRQANFRFLDNQVSSSFPDLAPYTVSGGALDGEIVVTELIGVQSEMRETFDRRLIIFDGDTGRFSITSTEAYGRRGFPYEIKVTNRTDLWRVRRLLYALRGRQISFYLATGYKDIRVTQTWQDISNTITIANTGYAKHARGRGRYKFIRIELTDGTVLMVEVTAFGEIDANEEQITVNITPTGDVAPESFRRVQFLERVRLDRDDVQIQHFDSLGSATVSFPVRSIIE